MTNSTDIGKVLKSGYVSAWDIKSKIENVEWLNGGCVSWRLNLCKDIFKRKYPKISWSVAEDLIYSYNKSKKYKLIISKNLKVKYSKTKSSSKVDILNYFKRGFLHSKVIKNFVIYENQLSLSKYYCAAFFILYWYFCFNINFQLK